MAVLRGGRVIDVPWGERFDEFLAQVGNSTYKYEGDELIHEMHKEVIETKWMLIHFYRRLRVMLAVCIGLLALIAVAMFIG